MLQHEYFAGLLVAVMAGGAVIGGNPGCSALGLFALLLFQLADRYLHNSFFDSHSKSISGLSADLEKIKKKQAEIDLKNAFGSNRG